MKYLFFLLLLFNIVFYLWETGLGQPEARHGQPSAESGQGIALLKELPGKPGDTTPGAPKDPQQSNDVSGTSGSLAGQQANRIGPQASDDPATAAKTDSPQDEGSQKDETCHWLGPFTSRNEAQTQLKKLGFASGQARPLKKRTEVENGFSIIYPAASTLQEAKTNRDMLEEKGLKGVWLVERGENQYAISIAVVFSKERADAALAHYRAQGLPLELKPRKTLADKWWLEIHGAIDPASVEAMPSQTAPGLPPVGVKDCE